MIRRATSSRLAKRITPWLAALAMLASGATQAQSLPRVEVYKSPTCECCDRWIEHLKRDGFSVNAHIVDNLGEARRKLGMPEHYGSCHSAKVGAYAVEGHVPAKDIKRLLKEQPKAIGLAMPGMPAGSPGMDIPNTPAFSTVLVLPNGTSRHYATHQSPKE